jgi:hypothetical protein
MFKWILNLYPPYLGTGISVKFIADDFRHIRVAMNLRWYNRNYVKTHFGGSLYAMTDPFFMLMLMKILGNAYIVWDRSAAIDFIRPGKGRVHADFIITADQAADIVSKTVSGEKYCPTFTVDILDAHDSVVARVKKELYVRKKRHNL